MSMCLSGLRPYSELSWWTFDSENVEFVNVIKDTTDPVPADEDILVLDLLKGITQKLSIWNKVRLNSGILSG